MSDWRSSSATVSCFRYCAPISVAKPGRDTSPGFTIAFVLLFSLPGPTADFGVYWLPGALLVLPVFLLLGVFVDCEPRTRRAAAAKLEARRPIGTLFGVFLWLPILGPVVTINLGYVSRQLQ